MAEQVYIVGGMSCDHCVAAVRREVEQLPGVDSVSVDLDSKRVTVAGTQLSEQLLIEAIDEAGYDAVLAASRP